MRLETVSNRRKPIIMLDYNISALLDSGAQLPVWVGTVELLEALFDGKHVDNCKAALSGFGGSGSVCDVYIIPCLNIKEYRIHDIPIAVDVQDTFGEDFRMVLPVSIFGNSSVNIKVSSNGRVVYVDVISLLGRYDIYCTAYSKDLKLNGTPITELYDVGVFYQNDKA